MRPIASSCERPVVFVSHCAKDEWVARRFADVIRSQGAEAFLAEDLDAGEDFSIAVRSALLRATEVLVYLTPWALERPWVWMEIGGAWVLDRRLIFVLHGLTVEELRRDSRFPLPILTVQSISVNELDSVYERELRHRVEQAV